ncbi:hypothetical protein [Prevotella sp.]|uniref:hypothetical protein n=1 Tax=Prevotella sp. TaxID=59823 RepID=UPI003AB95023
MAYDINATLERLEQNLKQLDSARKQVETTVQASEELQKAVAGYVASINALVVEIKEWEKQLAGTQVGISEEVQKALDKLTSTCEGITTKFTSSVDTSLQKFTEQNNLLAERVKELNALREDIKTTTKEIQTIKESLSVISKDLKDSQKGQDDAIASIQQKVDNLPSKIKEHADSITEKMNQWNQELKKLIEDTTPTIKSIDTKLDTVTNKVNSIQSSCDSIKRSTDNIINEIKNLQKEVVASSEATSKAININRWIIIAGIIILAALQFIR